MATNRRMTTKEKRGVQFAVLCCPGYNSWILTVFFLTLLDILSLLLFSWLHKLLFSLTSLLAWFCSPNPPTLECRWGQAIMGSCFFHACAQKSPVCITAAAICRATASTDPWQMCCNASRAASVIHLWHLGECVNPRRKGQAQTVPAAIQLGPLAAI